MPVGCQVGKPELIVGTPVHPFIRVLRVERISKGIALETLSQRLGYDLFTIGRWERGEATPSVLKFMDWRDALGFDLTLERRDRERT